jgi:hypothetical protein
MKIRTFAKSVGFDVVGNLRLMGKWNLCCRWYMDEGGNAYIVDVILGTIRIIPNKKG